MMATLVGLVHVFAGVVMLWSSLRITSAAGVRSTQARWALARRLIFASNSIALFGLGMCHLDGGLPDILRVVFQLMVVVGLIIFPLLRAFNWISQDQFKAVDSGDVQGVRRR